MTIKQKQELWDLITGTAFYEQEPIFTFIDQLIQRERMKAQLGLWKAIKKNGVPEELYQNIAIKSLKQELKDLTSEKENKFDQKFMVRGKDIKKQLIGLNISKPEQDEKR